jgi:hypothetical protein
MGWGRAGGGGGGRNDNDDGADNSAANEVMITPLLPQTDIPDIWVRRGGGGRKQNKDRLTSQINLAMKVRARSWRQKR